MVQAYAEMVQKYIDAIIEKHEHSIIGVDGYAPINFVLLLFGLHKKRDLFI